MGMEVAKGWFKDKEKDTPSFTSPDSPLSPSYPLHFPWAMKVCSLSPALQTFFLTMENNSVLPAELKV